MTLTLREFQKKLDEILQEYETPYWSPLSNTAQLVEEVGEVARVINHMYGDKPKKPGDGEDDLAGELGDVLFTVICIANSQGIDLQDQLQAGLDKLLIRDKDRHPKKK